MRNFVLITHPLLRNFCTYRFTFGIFYSLLIPVIPLFFDSIGMATVTIGTIMSLYGVSKTLTQMPAGVITDGIGDKIALLGALVLMSVVPFSYTLTENHLFVGGLYIIQGAILGMAAPGTYSLLARTLDPQKRGACTGMASAVFTLGGGVGAAIGGYLVARTGHYSFVFYLASIGIFLTAVYVLFALPRARKKKVSHPYQAHGESKWGTIVGEIHRYQLKYKIIALGALAFLGDYIYGCVVALFHFYGQDVLGASTIYTSAIIAIYLFVFGLGAPIAGWVSDHIGNNRQIFLAFVVMNVTLFGLGVVRNLTLFTAIIICYFLGATFLNAALQSSLSEFGENEKIKGIVFGFVGASESLGFAVGPFVSAYLYQWNKEWLFWGLLAVSVIIFTIYLLWHKKAQI